MIPTRRFLVGAAVAAVCALIASGCDTSPVAVSINTHEIKQTELNADLRAFAENKSYVAAYDAQQSSGSTAPSVVGSGPGTYSSTFVAGILNQDIENAALQQYLSAHHELPSAGLVAASRGWEAVGFGSIWLGFPAWFRTRLAEESADESQFVTPSKDVAAIDRAVHQEAGYLFSQVCVRQVGFSVDTAGGQVNYAASLAKATQALASGSTLSGGAVSCYSPPDLEAQGLSFYETIVKLAVGKATAPAKTSYGYQVYAVSSRTLLPLNADMARAATHFSEGQSGTSVSSLERQIVTGAKVHLNPQYGTWNTSSGVTPATPVAAGS